MTRLEGFINHFEKEGAVIDMADRSSACIAQKALPTNVHEGDFIVEDSEQHRLTVDSTITELHRREIRRMSEYFFD
ncbi:MAG: hypothetical protein PHQ83_10925 [Eubacteriales bacterium]|nr:hypothetical protein [Eubacteriales bacterium]